MRALALIERRKRQIELLREKAADGVLVNDATATLTRNQADGNAADGIAAVDGVAGSRNSATNNGGVDCAPIYLCSK